MPLSEHVPARAVAVLASMLLTGAAAPAHAQAPLRVRAYDNVHIRVTDPAKAADWYVAALGARMSTPPTAGTAQVVFGEVVVTIVQGKTVEPSLGTLIDHIGLSYANLDAAVKQAAAAGATVTAEPRESPGIFRYAYVEDPWGVRIEMVEDRERLGFHHVHVRVADPAATLAWYARHLGGTPDKLRGRLDGVRFGGVWLFAMSSGADRPGPPTAVQLVAFGVEDVDAGLKSLAADGVPTTAEARSLPALRYGFVQDPNGIRVELVRRTLAP